MIMNASIQKWGNSNAIRLPKPILKTADLSENDAVRITATKNQIVISKARRPHITFRERMKGFDAAYEQTLPDTVPMGTERFWENDHE
jgi:antitoxin MazE